MQLARSIFERITAQAIIPMVTLGVSAAIASAMMELLRNLREERAPVVERDSR
jgi:hypothetical protein